MEIISQVDRHMKTLTKYLKSVVEKTEDPKIIEYTQRQINNIEKIHKEIKKVVYHRETLCASESSRIIQDITVGERDSHLSRGRSSLRMPPPKEDKLQEKEIYIKQTDMSQITMATGSSTITKTNKRQAKVNLKCVVLGDKENATALSGLPHSEKKLRDRIVSSAGRNKRARQSSAAFEESFGN